MTFDGFVGQDITVHCTNGHRHRGTLKGVLLGVLQFEVGIDEFFILEEPIYAITKHGLSQAESKGF